jgi:hypothetical protein
MSHDDAGRAVDTLRAAGVDGRAVRVLMGEPERDARTEPTGQYAPGTLPADEPVGDFAGREHAQNEDMGTYARSTSGQRGGSYADADRDVITSYPNGLERVRVAEHGRLKRVLQDAGLDDATVDREVEALHMGRILVIADIGDQDAGAIAGGL